MALLGSSFQEVGRAAAEKHVGLFHIPMREHHEESQVRGAPPDCRLEKLCAVWRHRRGRGLYQSSARTGS